ncbi:MAG: hypothetical protein KGR26_14900 [Cyanobacteria bacterium REEB65]|nr:hypothetical protein [Cyanobacteria bacterium REEB65]
MTPDVPDTRPVAGRTLTAAGIASAVTGVLLVTLCCWAPAVIVALGLGSLYALLYGYRYVFGAAGAALVVAGLIWARRSRSVGACGCEEPLKSSKGDEDV